MKQTLYSRLNSCEHCYDILSVTRTASMSIWHITQEGHVFLRNVINRKDDLEKRICLFQKGNCSKILVLLSDCLCDVKHEKTLDDIGTNMGIAKPQNQLSFVGSSVKFLILVKIHCYKLFSNIDFVILVMEETFFRIRQKDSECYGYSAK